jgi:hypothetical protein
MGAFDDDSSGRRQVNMNLDPAFYNRIIEAIAVLKLKRKPSQIIAEIGEEFFEIWLASEKAKRAKLEDMKKNLLEETQTRSGYRTIELEKPRKKA